MEICALIVCICETLSDIFKTAQPEMIEPYRGPQELDEVTGMFPVARLILSAIAGPMRGHRYPFDGGHFVLGRAATCRISIPSEGVSRVHARVEYGNVGYWLIPGKRSTAHVSTTLWC
jgi:hypothetical protein